ncbi:hypothetical protein RKD41_000043 [Streptomyces tendae]
MTASSRHHAAPTATASVVTVLAAAANSVILAVAAGMSEGRWPSRGRVLAAGSRTAHHDPCVWITGPVRACCERGTTISSAAEQRTAAGAWCRPGAFGRGRR